MRQPLSPNTTTRRMSRGNDGSCVRSGNSPPRSISSEVLSARNLASQTVTAVSGMLPALSGSFLVPSILTRLRASERTSTLSGSPSAKKRGHSPFSMIARALSRLWSTSCTHAGTSAWTDRDSIVGRENAASLAKILNVSPPCSLRPLPHEWHLVRLAEVLSDGPNATSITVRKKDARSYDARDYLTVNNQGASLVQAWS